MSRGLTIADFVQQVLYAMYRVRLDVDASKEGAFHSHSDKFKEIVMEGNFMLQEFQKEQDWNFLRDRWEMGLAHNPPHGIQEFELPHDVYKVCTGYNDAVRIHHGHNPMAFEQILFSEARSGNAPTYEMFDAWGRTNTLNDDQRAFMVGNTLSFKRPWHKYELGCLLETDVIRYIEPMHICDDNCPDDCPLAYHDVLFTWMPDPLYFIIKTAASRAVADPSCTEVLQSLTDQATKLLSAIRENDSAHTDVDTWRTSELGYIEVL